MNWKKALLLFVLVDFSMLTAWALWSGGIQGILLTHTASPGGWQVMFDLVISVGLICAWMVADARERGVAAWPWVVAALFLGSLSPLAYLLRRETSEPRA